MIGRDKNPFDGHVKYDLEKKPEFIRAKTEKNRI